MPVRTGRVSSRDADPETSYTTRLLARGSVGAKGVYPPERCLDPDENDHVRALSYVIETTERRLAPGPGTVPAAPPAARPTSKAVQEPAQAEG